MFSYSEPQPKQAVQEDCTLFGCNRKQAHDSEFCQTHAADFESGREPSR